MPLTAEVKAKRKAARQAFYERERARRDQHRTETLVQIAARADRALEARRLYVPVSVAPIEGQTVYCEIGAHVRCPRPFTCRCACHELRSGL